MQNKILNSIWISFIIIMIILFAVFDTYQAFISQLWWWSFWKLDISQYETNSGQTITFNYKIYNLKWDIKSWFIDKNTLYSLYYTPFRVNKKTNNWSEEVYNYYKKYIINKEEIKYDELPFYFIYNSKNNKFAYLNAKKEIINWDLTNEYIDLNIIKKLDNSNTVKYLMTEFKTEIDKNFDINAEYPKLEIKFNEYLNQIIEQK